MKEKVQKRRALPKIGDIIYIDSALYLGHGVDDFEGGLSEIAYIKRRRGPDKQWEIKYKIEIEPSTTYYCSLKSFFDGQDELRKKFGDKHAHPNPDIDPRFNDDRGIFGTEKMLAIDALQILEPVLKKKWAPLHLWKTVIKCLIILKQFDVAIEAARLYLSRVESDVEEWINLGISYAELHQLDKAENVFQKTLKLDPGNVTAYFCLGVCCAQEGKIRYAEQAFKMFAALNPTSTDAQLTTILALRNNERVLVNEYLEPRILAALYTKAVTITDDDLCCVQESLDELGLLYEKRLSEAEEKYGALRQICCAKPIAAYQAHMCFTGHWAAASQLLIIFRKYLKGSILDVGCGTGDMEFLLSLIIECDLVEINEIYAIDVNKEALEHAAKVITLLAPNVWLQQITFHFHEADIASEKWDTPSANAFDTIIISFVVHWLNERLSKAIKNIAKSLKQGGKLVVISEYPLVITPSPFNEQAKRRNDRMLDSSRGVSVEELIKLCELEGMRPIGNRNILVTSPFFKYNHQAFGVVFEKN